MTTRSRWIFLGILVLVGIGAVGLLSSVFGGGSHQGAHDSDRLDLTDRTHVVIEIRESGYEPAHITIKSGTTVAWVNRDSEQHNAMDGRDHAEAGMMHHGSVDIEKENHDGMPLAGPLLAQGEVYNYRFVKPDEYPYHCLRHPDMKGSVVVVE